jgi:hypothetical protein
MAEENQLIIEISAKTVELVQGLATAENALKDFGTTGNVSIESLNTALKALKKAAEKSVDPEEIKKFGEAYGVIEGRVKDVKKAFNDAAQGVDKLNDEFTETQVVANAATKAINNTAAGGKNFDESARRSRIAVYGLNQVVRDAPFGFIAISNNLPILFDQFGQLQRETGGTINALKSFGKALVGPAGIAIAVSSVIGVITGLVQKYGSLSKAVDALFGKTNQLSEEQIKYSEKLAGEIANISVLVNAYPNLADKREEQEGVLKKLNSIAPQYFKNLNTEKTTIDQLTTAYDNYIKSFVAKIFIEQQTKQIEELAKSYTQSLIQLLEKEKQVREQQQKRINTTKTQIQRQEELARINNSLRRGGDISIGVDILVKEPPKTFQELIDELTNKFKGSTKELLDIQKGFFKAIDFTGVFAQTDVDNAAEKKSLKDKIADLQESKKALEDELAITGRITDSYADISIKISEIQRKIDQLKNPELTLKINSRVDAEIQKIQSDLKSAQFEAGRVRFNITDSIDAATKEINKELPKKISKFDIKNIALNISPKVLKDIEAYRLNLALLEERYKRLEPVINAVSGAIVDQFGRFIDQMIDGFEEGQTAMEAFQDTLKELGKTILKELAKLALLAAIRAISESIAPGSGAVTAGAAGQALGVTRALGTARRGVNVGTGGLALAGNVTFVQRGQDLVGVLARANSRINRVG